MPIAPVNGTDICYQTFGDAGSPALLLVMGLATQMIAWDESLCRELAGSGLFVIRFDNRDVGLSSHDGRWGVPDLQAMGDQIRRGLTPDVPYTMGDLAADAFGLLDHLGIERAHICGMSMGGFIVQTMALQQPERLLSLTSIASGTGNPELPPPRPEVLALISAPYPEDLEEAKEHQMKIYRETAGDGFAFDEPWHLRLVEESYARGVHPMGNIRQYLAVMNQPNRKPALAGVRTPTLVVHGTADPLVPLTSGRDTAEAIPGARLLVVEGMGHDLPNGRGGWPRIIEALLEHIRAGGGPAA